LVKKPAGFLASCGLSTAPLAILGRLPHPFGISPNFMA
jgi:hypothetical protein